MCSQGRQALESMRHESEKPQRGDGETCAPTDVAPLGLTRISSPPTRASRTSCKSHISLAEDGSETAPANLDANIIDDSTSRVS